MGELHSSCAFRCRAEMLKLHAWVSYWIATSPGQGTSVLMRYLVGLLDVDLWHGINAQRAFAVAVTIISMYL